MIPTAVRGVPLGVIQATNWVFSVLAFELESFLKGLRPRAIEMLESSILPSGTNVAGCEDGSVSSRGGSTSGRGL